MAIVDALLTWKPATSSSATNYQVTWTCGAINKVATYPAADKDGVAFSDFTAVFSSDTGYTPIHGNVVSASVVAVDSLGQQSTKVFPIPSSVTIPTPPPPNPPTNVVLTTGPTPVPTS